MLNKLDFESYEGSRIYSNIVKNKLYTKGLISVSFGDSSYTDQSHLSRCDWAIYLENARIELRDAGE